MGASLKCQAAFTFGGNDTPDLDTPPHCEAEENRNSRVAEILDGYTQMTETAPLDCCSVTHHRKLTKLFFFF